MGSSGSLHSSQSRPFPQPSTHRILPYPPESSLLTYQHRGKTALPNSHARELLVTMSVPPRTPSPKPQLSRATHYRHHSEQSPTIVTQYIPGLELPSTDRHAQLLKQPSPFDSPTFDFQSTSAKENEFGQFLIRTSNHVPLEAPRSRLSSFGSPSPISPKSLLQYSPAGSGTDDPYEPFRFENSKRFLAFELHKLAYAEDPHYKPNYPSPGSEDLPKKRSVATDTNVKSSGNDLCPRRKAISIVDGDTMEKQPKKRVKLCDPDTTNSSLADPQQPLHPRVHPLYSARYGEGSGWNVPSMMK
ncbi:hypothetical protein Daesc_000963 [Daldinia eschscholtzii]|uniref:Uncharacterized protein n=1 Tax=Daldinia eschscholtzii TaxID=292717 RepID=A0AAX6MZV0_9PEZI